MTENIQQKAYLARQIAYSELKNKPEYKFMPIPQSVLDNETSKYIKLSLVELQKRVKSLPNILSGSGHKQDLYDILGFTPQQRKQAEIVGKQHAQEIRKLINTPKSEWKKLKKQEFHPTKELVPLSEKELETFASDTLFRMLAAASDAIHKYHDSIGYISGDAAWQGFKEIGNLVSFGHVETIWKEMDKIDNLLQEATKLKDHSNQRDFKRIYKEFTGINFNPQAVQKYVDMVRHGDSEESKTYKNAVKGAFGKDYSAETMNSIKTQKTAGSVMDIVMMVAGTEALAGTKLLGAFSKMAISSLGKVGGATLTGGTEMALWSAGTGTVNALTKKAPTTKEDFINVGKSTAEGFGIGAFGGFLNTTAVAKVTKLFSKSDTQAIGKAMGDLTTKGELSGQDFMKTFIKFSKPGLLAKAGGFATEVAGFTGYSIAEQITKDIVSGKSTLNKNASFEDVCKYIGENFKEQCKSLVEIKSIAKLVMMIQGGRLSGAAINSMTDNLKDFKVKYSEGKYEVSASDGKSFTTDNPDKIAGILYTSMLKTNKVKTNKSNNDRTQKYQGKSAKYKVVKFVIKNTKIGRRIQTGLNRAAISVKNDFVSTNTKDFGAIKDGIKEKLTKGFSKIANNLSNDKEFIRLFNSFVQKNRKNNPNLKKDITEYDFSGASDATIIKNIIETSGVGVTKLAQIISKDKTIMDNLRNTLPEAEFKSLQEALINCQSKCDFSRTAEEAQLEINKAFPAEPKSNTEIIVSGDKNALGKYKIIKQNSAGSVGETFWALDEQGNKVIVKMLKDGVDVEQLGMEEKLFKKIIGTMVDSPADRQKYEVLIHNQYKEWLAELDFKQEAINNKELALGAERYTVAKVQNVSKDGTILVMDKARGVQMNKVMEMLEAYKKNPETYNETFKNIIEDNPWLRNPQSVMKELPSTLIKTFDEQLFFMKKGGKTKMHGDPHMGNLFVYNDANGKPKIEFIDTGNCITRDGEQIKSDIKFFSNYLVGNSEGVVKYFMEKAGIDPEAKPELLKKLTEEMDKRVFKKGQNITQFVAVQKEFNKIIEEAGLDLGSEDSNALKAQLQFISNISSINALNRKSLEIDIMFKDIPKALIQMARRGVNPVPTVKDAIKYAYNNKSAALSNAFQFHYKKPSSPEGIVKYTGTRQDEAYTSQYARTAFKELASLIKNRHNMTQEEFNEKINIIVENGHLVKAQAEEFINHIMNK